MISKSIRVKNKYILLSIKTIAERILLMCSAGLKCSANYWKDLDLAGFYIPVCIE